MLKQEKIDMYVNQCIKLEENYFNLYGEIVKYKRVENDLREEIRLKDEEIENFKRLLLQKDQLMK